jgi:catechol-2,3-dioxygenase
MKWGKDELSDAGAPAGVTIDSMSDYMVSQSLYLHDPDGNEVEGDLKK